RDLNLAEVRVESPRKGFIAGVEAAEIGRAVAEIGGGRARMEDTLDPAVGYLAEAMIGDEVGEGEVLGLIYCRDEASGRAAAERIRAAYTVAEERPVEIPELVKEVITQ
ncbi:MAG TPA: hypothetical protein VFX96_12840, partial [Pyrinomonadaceae bacterium]|nr:hypothetical protein [Pyrinomonadaceae bacterium]